MILLGLSVRSKRLKYFKNPKIAEESLLISRDHIQIQEMILLVGPPACGKSTYCKKQEFSDYIIINQDLLKTKKNVLASINESLKNGKKDFQFMAE